MCGAKSECLPGSLFLCVILRVLLEFVPVGSGAEVVSRALVVRGEFGVLLHHQTADGVASSLRSGRLFLLRENRKRHTQGEDEADGDKAVSHMSDVRGILTQFLPDATVLFNETLPWPDEWPLPADRRNRLVGV